MLIQASFWTHYFEVNQFVKLAVALRRDQTKRASDRFTASFNFYFPIPTTVIGMKVPRTALKRYSAICPNIWTGHKNSYTSIESAMLGQVAAE